MHLSLHLLRHRHFGPPDVYKRQAEQRGATAVEQTPGPLAGEQPAEVEPGIGIKLSLIHI